MTKLSKAALDGADRVLRYVERKAPSLRHLEVARLIQDAIDGKPEKRRPNHG